MNRFPVNLFFCTVVCVAAFAQSPEQSPKPAEQVFKNVQVLKGIPGYELLPTMQFISSSLGVECEFCHVRGAFEKDDKKPKQIARKMIELQLAIDRDNFKGERAVTCYSCHRGAENPVSVPVISAEPPKRPEAENAEAATPALPSAEDILSKYVQAMGGAAAIEKITSRVQTGTISLGGRQFPVEVLAKDPNKRISTVHTPNGDNITAFDGHDGWIANPGPRPPREMSVPETEAAGFEATFHMPTQLTKMFARFRVLPAEKIDGHDVLQVVGLTEGKPPTRFFFEKESGLLARTIRYTDTPLGRNPTQIDYADYHEEDGVKIPLQWTVARPAGRFTIRISKVEQNVPIADSKFEKPVAPAGQKPPAN